jgi:hypothetical protein
MVEWELAQALAWFFSQPVLRMALLAGSFVLAPHKNKTSSNKSQPPKQPHEDHLEGD